MGMETVGLLMVCAAVVLACRVFRVPATLPLLVTTLALLQVGALQAAAVPGLAQLAAAKTDLDNWTKERTQAAVEAVRQARAYSNALEEPAGEPAQASPGSADY